MKARLITIREVIRTVLERWKRTYFRNGSWSHNGKNIYDKLLELDLETCSNVEVAQVIGNFTWADLKCHGCDTDRFLLEVVVVGEESDYESSTAFLCKACVLEALKAFE